MKKWIIALLTAVLALPVFGTAVFADENSKKNYSIGVEEVTLDGFGMEVSGFFSPAVLTVENGELFIELSHFGTGHLVEILEINGNVAVEKNLDYENDRNTYKFKFEPNEDLRAVMDLTYRDEPYTGEIILVEDEVKKALDAIAAGQDGEETEVKEPEEESRPEKVIGEAIDSDEKYAVNYHASNMDLSRYYDNPATLVIKDGKQYIQMSGSMEQFIDKLTYNGDEVTWIEINQDDSYTVQFEIDSLSEERVFSMYLDIYGTPMEHHANLSFEIEVEAGETVDLLPGSKIKLPSESKSNLIAPSNLPAGVEVNVVPKKETELKNLSELMIAGDVFDFTLAGIDNFDGDFQLVMSYDTSKYDAEDVDIYYYNEVNNEWEAQGGTVNDDGTITIYTDHFSMYGVFATPSLDVEPEPEVIEEVDYVIYHETKEEASIADGYFTNKATLIEVNGKKYLQLVTDSPGVFEYLRSKEFGEFELVDESGVFQVEVPADFDLNEIFVLEMHIFIPGAYDQEHSTRVVFNVKPEESTEVPNEDSKPTPAPKKDVKPTKVDRAYTINFTIFDEDGNKVSAADQFFENPAVLLEKDGVYYVQFTTNANQYINSLSNEYGDFLYVGEDANGNHIYQFRLVGDLTDEQVIDMVITVPGVYNRQEHTTRLVFDLDTKEEVSADDYQLVASDESGNGPNSDGTHTVVLDENTPDKPELDPVDNGNTNQSEVNPKTGENTNIMLYILLMLASAVPLVIKARRHFA